MYNTITSLYRNCWLIIFQLLSKLDFLIDTVPEILNSLPPLFAFILFAPLFAFWLEFDGTTLVEIFCHIGQKFSMSTKHIRVLSFLHIFINLLAFFIKYFLRFLIDNEWPTICYVFESFQLVLRIKPVKSRTIIKDIGWELS